MKKTGIALVIIFFSIGNLFSQESLLLNSGKRILISDIKIDSTGVIFYKNFKGKVNWIEYEDVFSWTRSDSVEVIFYKPACIDVCFRIDQMRDYLHGQADGRMVNTYSANIIGYVVGAGSGIFMSALGLFIISPLPPAINSGLLGAFRPKAEKKDIAEKYKENMHYKEGFSNSLRKKRVVNSIISGASGLVSGIVFISIFSK